MSELRAAYIHDAAGNAILSTGGAIHIYDPDLGTPIINSSFHRHTAVTTTLSVATTGSGSEYVLTVGSTTGFAVGDYLHVENGGMETTHPKVISLTATTFTLDRRIDLAHPIGTTVTQAILDISSTAGTMAAPITYWTGPIAGEIWHLYRILPVMTHTTAGDLGLFGNLTALTNGCILRVKVSGAYTTFTNWKTNGDIKSDMYDVDFDTRSGGAGIYGTSGRGTFRAAGTVVVLDGNNGDQIEIVVQDDITTLLSFNMKVQGHKEL